jgi:hypothetical protein
MPRRRIPILIAAPFPSRSPRYRSSYFPAFLHDHANAATPDSALPRLECYPKVTYCLI